MNYRTQHLIDFMKQVVALGMAGTLMHAPMVMLQAGQPLRIERTTVEKVLDPLEETWHRIASDMDLRIQSALGILKEVMAIYSSDKAVVAWDGRQLVGVAVYRMEYYADLQIRETHIYELASFTHKPGVGRLLVKEVIKIAREGNSDTVVVECAAGTEKFYGGLGFKRGSPYPGEPNLMVYTLHSGKELPQVEQPTLLESENGLQVFFAGERASATLSWLDPDLLFPGVDLGPGKWLWFNRLINQSGKPRLGTMLLDAVLAHCEKNHYSILNEVSAYGALSQRDLEDWYMSKGFKPVDYKQYKNKLLVWRPTK